MHSLTGNNQSDRKKINACQGLERHEGASRAVGNTLCLSCGYTIIVLTKIYKVLSKRVNFITCKLYQLFLNKHDLHV